MEILDILQGFNYHALFFMQGRWVEAYPEIAKRIASEGHEVATHGFAHAPFTWLTREGAISDLKRAEDTISTVTGKGPWKFRYPFGIEAHTNLMPELGYTKIGWQVSSNDWKADTDVASEVIGKEGYALFHTWSKLTVAALPRILESLEDAS